MANSEKGYLPTLDGWRAIAVFAVLLDHTVAEGFRHTFPRFFALSRTGPNGVSLFFAISGFLICSRLLEEQQMCGRISLAGFYVRRACRILPAALAYLLVISILGLTGVLIVTPWEWWSSVFFFRNYLPYHLINRGWGGFTIHYWSLAIEEHFYLLWPATLAIAGRVRARYIAICGSVVVAIWRWWDLQHGWFSQHVPGLLFPSRTDVRLDALLMGCLAALLLENPRWRAGFVRHFKPSLWWSRVAVYMLIQIVSRQHRYTLWESMLLPLIVTGTVYRPDRLVSKVLETSWIRWIGRLSYSLYLWQQLFSIQGGKYPLALLERFPANIAMVFLMATLSYKFLERPMIRLGHRLAPPPTPGRQDISTRPAPALIAQAAVAEG